MEREVLIFWGVLGLLLAAFLLLPVYWVFRKSQELSKPKTLLRKVVDAAFLPFNFGALFLEERKVSDLPFYYRWFLSFVEVTSRIKYFHFFPKAVVALASEGIVHVLTHQDILTAIVFSWSVLFLFLVMFVEHHSGEMEEKSVIFANKIFLYTVSMLTLVVLLVYFFFWDFIGPILDVPFLHFMGNLAFMFNEYLLIAWQYFWALPLWMQLTSFSIFLLYIIASLVLSKKG